MKSFYIASDHAGIDLKNALVTHLTGRGFHVHDLGPSEADGRVDYPDYASALSRRVADGKAEGILLCGTGIGMSMAANRVAGIRAALAHDRYTATMAREHNNANVLVLGARILDEDMAKSMVDVWVDGVFEVRHQTRLDKLHAIETEEPQG